MHPHTNSTRSDQDWYLAGGLTRRQRAQAEALTTRTPNEGLMAVQTQDVDRPTSKAETRSSISSLPNPRARRGRGRPQATTTAQPKARKPTSRQWRQKVDSVQSYWFDLLCFSEKDVLCIPEAELWKIRTAITQALRDKDLSALSTIQTRLKAVKSSICSKNAGRNAHAEFERSSEVQRDEFQHRSFQESTQAIQHLVQNQRTIKLARRDRNTTAREILLDATTDLAMACKPPNIIPLWKYYWINILGEAIPSSSVLWLSHEEFRWLARNNFSSPNHQYYDGQLLRNIPVLVRSNERHRARLPLLTRQDLEHLLINLTSLSVQDSRDICPGRKLSRWPRDVTGREALRDIGQLDRDVYPYNILSLGAIRPADPDLYHLRRTLVFPNLLSVASPVPQQGSDKPTVKISQNKAKGDLSVCHGFCIFGQRGSISNLHWDCGGMWTSIEVQFGKKLWWLCDALSAEDLEQVEQAAKDGKRLRTVSNIKAKPILLEPGTMLLQPPASLHFPYSIEDTLITGSMLVDLTRPEQMIRQLIIEAKAPDVTNEDPHLDARWALEVVLASIESGHGPVTMSKDELDGLRAELRLLDGYLGDDYLERAKTKIEELNEVARALGWESTSSKVRDVAKSLRDCMKSMKELGKESARASCHSRA